MSGSEFFRTPMGKRFYEHTMPELVRQLTRLNDALEAIVAAAARKRIESFGKEEGRG